MSTQEPNQPDEEQIRAAMEEQMRTLRVQDVVLQTVVSLVNLGARRCGLTGAGPEEHDPTQVQLAIDGARALLPLVSEEAEPQTLGQIREALSQLQMAYVRRRGEQTGTGEAGEQSSTPDAAQPSPSSAPQGGDQGAQERRQGPAESSGRLWIPGQ